MEGEIFGLAVFRDGRATVQVQPHTGRQEEWANIDRDKDIGLVQTHADLDTDAQTDTIIDRDRYMDKDTADIGKKRIDLTL